MLHYLASPYNHADPAVMEQRRSAACKKAGELISAGISVLSPIAHNVAIIREVGSASGWQTWKAQDSAMLAACSRVLVLKLPGWEQSVGVAAEIALANEFGKPVQYIEP